MMTPVSRATRSCLLIGALCLLIFPLLTTTEARAQTIPPSNTLITDLNPYPATGERSEFCLLYTSPSPRDISGSRMPSSA